jgi:hypothetical protein
MNAEIRDLVAELEAARMEHLKRLIGCNIDTSTAELRSLADLQAALTAARDVLEVHEPRLGHGSESEL